MTKNEIKLKVAESLSQRDIGRAIARIDPNIMAQLNINANEIIEIIRMRA